MQKSFHFLYLSFIFIPMAFAYPKGTITDEELMPKHTLEQPLLNGKMPIKDVLTWKEKRKKIYHFFETQVYGKTPTSWKGTKIISEKSKYVHDNKVIMQQLKIQLTDHGPIVNTIIFKPNSIGTHPAFMGLNFKGNHTIHNDSDIDITSSWVRNDKKTGLTNNKARAKDRGISSSRWPVELVTQQGFALISTYYGDIDPDFDDGFKNGIHAAIKAGTSALPAKDEWGSISAWSWGLSRILDALDESTNIKTDEVFVIGHSRLGKTALWSGVRDPRFAGAIVNNSGCGGAAPSKRGFGETVSRINTNFPHWFADNFLQYSNNEAALPYDQHHLVAICAPTPVYIASATKDLWADPKGEFLSAKLASPVYELMTGSGLGISDFPNPNTPSIGRVSYHLREGKHDITEYDWKCYIQFAEKFIK